jgi:hypothetical protein
MIAQPVPANEVVISMPADTHHLNQLIRRWIHSKGPHTQRNYRRIVAGFRAFIGAPLAQVALGGL